MRPRTIITPVKSVSVHLGGSTEVSIRRGLVAEPLGTTVPRYRAPSLLRNRLSYYCCCCCCCKPKMLLLHFCLLFAFAGVLSLQLLFKISRMENSVDLAIRYLCSDNWLTLIFISKDWCTWFVSSNFLHLQTDKRVGRIFFLQKIFPVSHSVTGSVARVCALLLESWVQVPNRKYFFKNISIVTNVLPVPLK